MPNTVITNFERKESAFLVSGHRSLTEQELVYSNDWFILLRWLAGLGATAAAIAVYLFPKIGLPALPIFVIGLCVLTYNLLFFLLARRLNTSIRNPETYQRLAFAQMILDWIAITLLIQFSGGIVSPLILFFVFHIVIASIFFTRKVSLLLTILAIMLFTGIVILEYFSILPHYPISTLSKFDIYTDSLYIAIILVFFVSTMIIVTYLVTSISGRLRDREAEVIKLSEDLKISSARLQSLNDSAQVINSTLELTQVMNRLVDNTTRVMGVHACSIRLLDESSNVLKLVASYGLSQEYLNKGPIIVDNSLMVQEALDGKIINIPDVVAQSEYLQYPDWAVKEGISSILTVPLVGKNRTLGIIHAYSEEINHFTTDDEAFLSAIAAQGSIAIENALAYQTIETLDATKAAFIRVFTHELRSPVSVTRSLLQTILAGYVGQVTDQQKDILERATRRIDFLRKLIDDLLDLANGRSPRPSKEVSHIDLHEILERVVDRFRLPAQEKGISLTYQTDPIKENRIVIATVEGLDRIFNNLVSNAIKYTPQGGNVDLSLNHTANEVNIKIEDTGIGIPEDAIPHLFEEFFRAPNAREVEREGTGLGLSIVRETLNHYRGQIAVQSQPGAGSFFTVTLPLAKN